MAAERRNRGRWALPAGVAVLAAGAAVTVPALAGGGQPHAAKAPTLASLAKDVKALRAQDATLRARIASLSKRASVAGVAGPTGAQGPPGAPGVAGAPGAAGGADAYTRAESDARFAHGSTSEALVRVEVAPNANPTLVDLGPLGQLLGACGGLSTPPGSVLQPPTSQTGPIDVVADTGVVDPMSGSPSLVLKTIDPAAPAPVGLFGTGQAYHAVVHVAQGVGPGARIAALEVTGFKAAAGTLPCRFTVRVTTAGLG